ncbi:MAG: hypothetical protein NT167_30060, partial [Verrucomicrobia bacterium]|nr:hypothetical protein [Verrucomicrobiota bacterium]
GASYALEWRTNLMAGPWQYGWHLPMTNVFQEFGVGITKPGQFYQAYEFFADPPILELGSHSSSNLSLLLYGKNGTSYILQATTNLANTNAWFPATNFVLTNSFQFIHQGTATNRLLFYRAKRP